MHIRKTRTQKFLMAPVILVLLASSLLLTGCGKNKGKVATTTEEKPRSTSPKSSDRIKFEDEEEQEKPKATTEEKPKSVDEKAVDAAIEYVRRNFPNLGELDVLDVKVLDLKWARVVLQPKDKSTDAAAAYLKEENGIWTVFDFGTGISPEQHPEAPKELFE